MQGMQAAGTRHRDTSPIKGRGIPQYTTPSNSVTHSPAHSTRSPRGMSAGGGGEWRPAAADTQALTYSPQTYELEAALADGDVVTLARGTLMVVKDI